MPDGLPLSDEARGEMFLDARGPGRALRLTWHPEAEIVVLSLWRDGTCAGTFRLSRSDVGDFVDALVDGLRAAPGVHLPVRDTGFHLASDAAEPATPPADWSSWGAAAASPAAARSVPASTRAGAPYGEQPAATLEPAVDSGAGQEPAGFLDWVFAPDREAPRASTR